MTDGNEDAVNGKLFVGTAFKVLELKTRHTLVVTQNFFHFKGRVQHNLSFLDDIHQFVDKNRFGLERTATVHEMHDAGNLREVKRFFNSSIAAADNRHGLTAIEESVAGCAARNAAALVLGFAFKPEILSAGPRCDDERITRVSPHIAFQTNRLFLEVRSVNDIKDNLGIKALSLFEQVLHQLRSFNTVDRARPVVHFSGCHQLTALLHAGDQQGLEIGTGSVDGCRVARRTGTDDNNRCVYALAHGVSFQIRAEGRASARPRDGFFRL